MDIPRPPVSGEVPQGRPPPPQYPYGYGGPQRPPLNGLAVASLVLGLVVDAPEVEIEVDLESYRTWAVQVSRTLTGHARQLRAHPWPAPAEKAVQDRIREIEAAQKHWAKAAGATDEETFWEHWDAAELALDTEVRAKDAKAREALGLDTTPPVYEDSDDSSGSGFGDVSGDASGEGGSATGGSGPA
ncbi:hypothetical protein [Streptomyces sp. NPDC051219]|uniref:hypothetical protein n=1 Tax=Streptomyces sp. NPDC051219 TaxID=3155283 RepID=UPI0034250FCC